MKNKVLAVVVGVTTLLIFACKGPSNRDDVTRLLNTSESATSDNLWGMYNGFGAEAMRRTVRLQFQLKSGNFPLNQHVGSGFILDKHRIVTSFHGPASFLEFFDLSEHSSFSFSKQLDASILEGRLIITDSLKNQILSVDFDVKSFLRGKHKAVTLKSPQKIAQSASGNAIHGLGFAVFEFNEHDFEMLLDADRPFSPIVWDPNFIEPGKSVYSLSYRATDEINPIRHARIKSGTGFDVAYNGPYAGMYFRTSSDDLSGDLRRSSLGGPLLFISDQGISLVGVKYLVGEHGKNAGVNEGRKLEIFNMFNHHIIYDYLKRNGFPLVEKIGCPPR